MTFGLSGAAIGGIVAGVGAVGGAAMSASAAKDAARTQADATRAANQLTQEQFEAVRNDLAPYRTYGSDAINKLSQLLGIAPRAGTAADYQRQIDNIQVPDTYIGGQTNDPLWEQVLARHNSEHQSKFGIPMNRAWTADADAMNAYGVLSERYKTAKRAELEAQAAQAAQEPQTTDPNYGSLLRKFTGEDLAQDPGYQFGLDQGQQALDRRLASGGNYFSGAALKGATRFNQDYASGKFTDAFNRDAASKNQIFNFLSGGASLGQNASAQTGNAGQTMAQQVGVNTTSMANAAGAAQIASGNAWNGALGNMNNYYQQNALINAINGGNRGWGSTSNNLSNGPSNNAGMYSLDSSFDQYRQP